MMKRRADLKDYFALGQVPTDKHFRDLIDSMVNCIDDRFVRQDNFGLKLGANTVDTNTDVNELIIRRLISLYKSINNINEDPTWFLDLLSEKVPPRNQASHGLSFSEPIVDPTQADSDPPKSESRLYLQPGGRVGIGTQQPQALLDVNGFVASKGRMGTYQDQTTTNRVVADGRWHPIISNLTGLNAFEIVAAAYGTEGKGQYSIAHAIALSAFGSSGSRIRRTNAWFDWWSLFQKIKFRWTGDHTSYNLEIRTNGNFGDDTWIVYHITQLFNNQRPVVDG